MSFHLKQPIYRHIYFLVKKKIVLKLFQSIPDQQGELLHCAFCPDNLNRFDADI